MNSELVQTTTVFRTNAVGEKERYDEDGKEEGRVVSEYLCPGSKECFKGEWLEGWCPAPENLHKHQLRPRGAEIPDGQAKANKTHERKHKKEV